MKELQDSGAPLGRRVRLIFGQCEETGDWADMKYYLEHEEKPVFGFTPDADFPAIYGEKGILEYKISLPLEGSGLISVEGGEASNVVPDWARCTYLDAAGEQRTIVTSGKSAHASTPEKGDNAIDKLMAALVSAGVESPLADFYAKRLMGDYHGGKLGCPLCDVESGRLTVNAGLLRTEGDTVTLTTKPAEGYLLDTLTVTGRRGDTRARGRVPLRHGRHERADRHRRRHLRPGHARHRGLRPHAPRPRVHRASARRVRPRGGPARREGDIPPRHRAPRESVKYGGKP